VPASAGATPRKLVRRDEAVRILHQVQAVRNGSYAKTGFELTLLLKELGNRLPDLSPRDRRTATRMMLRPTIGQAQPGEDAYAIPEHNPPLCTVHFCIHWVDHNVPGHADAPPSKDANHNLIPDYVETMSQVFEHVHQVENGELGWREPVGDGTRGGGVDKTDVYIKELGDQGIFGYSTPDPNQKTNSQFAYLVMDNDYSQAEFPRYSNPLLPMEVTAAHEYNHVLQFGYDWLQDTWLLESTAVWMEDKVYNSVNDYVSYLKPWTQLTQVPLTSFDAADPSDPINVKVYGDAVWERWIEAHYGPDTVRAPWERSLQTNPPSFAPAAYDSALRSQGTNLFEAFTRFAADTAEWRSTAGPFEEGNTWPAIQRASKKTLAPGLGLSGHLDHTAYALINVARTGDKRIRLVGTLPKGTAGAFALVGRTGTETSGAIEVQLRRLPKGGRGRVSLDNPGRFSRITAVLVNADVSQRGFDPSIGDWAFTKDGRPVSALVSNDFVPPTLLGRSPADGKTGVSRNSSVAVRFSEPVTGVSTRSFRLIGSSGHRVSARVKYDPKTHRAHLIPKHRLSAHASYSVRLTGGIVDRGLNGILTERRTWGFRTGG
jgi:Bacterial Ig-like domain